MFIWPCYPSEVLKGGERGAPFVPQEPADGCNPFQNAHWKSIKTGWTWCMSVEAGDTFLREGVPAKKHKLGQTSVFGAFPPKKSIVRRDRGNELRPPPTKARSLLVHLSRTQLPSPLPYPGADIACRGYSHKKLQTLTSYSKKATWRHSLWQDKETGSHGTRREKIHTMTLLIDMLMFSRYNVYQINHCGLAYKQANMC